jgi:methionyl-tRNA synthetase
MKTQRYITTPLYYVNARPHLGHAYTTIMADVVKRHYTQRGEQVVFLTGTDEHGEKIAQIAAREGKQPQQLADEVSADFKDTWQKMNLGFDIFYRTTAPTHVAAVKEALNRLKASGQIEFREYEGNYCVGCERFLTDTELTAEGNCPDHQKKPEYRKEGNYFFLMSQYQQKLIDYFQAHPNCIRPEQYRGEMLSFLKNEKLGDLCISRPKSRLTWGIELPFDSNFVTYVWVDALLNYLAATGWPDSQKFNEALWNQAVHLIGKDIVKTHAIYWFSILMALGVKPPQALNVNGYWLIGGTKMSKSLGNVIRPLDVEATYGRETLRFYLLREMSYGNDSTFTLESFVNSVNAHLANGIGNLCSRVLTLCQKNGVTGVPAGTALEPADQALLDRRAHALQEWNSAFEELKYQNAVKAWSELVTACDLYINEQKPWALAKDPAQSNRLHTVLAVCMQVIEALGVLIYPVLPEASAKICSALGLEKPDLSVIARKEVRQFPAITEVPKLFMRVALPVETEAKA